LVPRFLPKLLHHSVVEQIRHAVRAASGFARVGGLVGEESVPEFGVVAVSIEQGVGPIRLATAASVPRRCNSHSTRNR
jgi:hypothetical protein